ncbi:EAL domain-containing protein [Aeromonas veronii]
MDALAIFIPVLLGLFSSKLIIEFITCNLIAWVMVYFGSRLISEKDKQKKFSLYCIKTTIAVSIFSSFLMTITNWFSLYDIRDLTHWALIFCAVLILIKPSDKTSFTCNLICVTLFTFSFFTRKVPLSEQYILVMLLVVFNALSILIQIKFKMESALAVKVKQLLHDSETDHLTGLLNRRGFLNACDAAIFSKKEFLLGYVDVNKFKMINDTLGHIVGDTFLCKVGEKISITLGENSLIGRIGGDEFSFITFQSDYEDICIRLSLLNQQEVIIGKHELPLSLSIGCCRYPQDSDVKDNLFQMADSAMFTAKKLGSRKPMHYSCHMSEFKPPQFSITELRDLLDQCYAVYQPVIDVENSCIKYVEALVRHPAIDTKFVINACAYHQQWDALFSRMLALSTLVIDRFSIPVALNVVPSQLMSGNQLIATLESINNKKYFNYIIIEVTESEPITEPTIFNNTVEHLKKMGIKLSLDDFGAGFSFFEALNAGEFDCIKIDRRLISGINSNKKKQSLLLAVKRYCDDIGIKIVAEGVEHENEIAYLKSIDIKLMQGYGLYMPMRVGLLEELLTSKNNQI